MTYDDVEAILSYHNLNGFENDYKDLVARVCELKKCQTEIKSFYFSLAIPSNKNQCSPVEITVMNNVSILQMELYANELKRFIDKLERILDTLPYDEKRIIKHRYMTKTGKVTTFEKLSEELGINSISHMININKKALTNIKTQLENNGEGNASLILFNNLVVSAAYSV